MNRAAEDRTQVSLALSDIYTPVQNACSRWKNSSARSFAASILSSIGWSNMRVRLGGKRLRPALVLLSAQACGRLRHEHLALAAAVEIIHTATLIHDDVLDEATLRRHLDTVNSRWNNETSVLLGDYLLTRSLCLTASMETPYACRTIGEASRTMCEGELRQIASRGNFDLTEEEYLGIIADKTAALTACCCRLGAHYADADPEIEAALVEYGLDLGIAFQIADDLLDVLGDEATVGKSLGSDLMKQKSTLPLIRVFQQANRAQRSEILALLSAGDNHHREALRPWLERFDAIGYAQEMARSYSRRAAEAIAALPPSEAREALGRLADFVVMRQH